MLDVDELTNVAEARVLFDEMITFYQNEYNRKFKEIFSHKINKLNDGELQALGLWDKGKLVGYLEYEITLKNKVSFYILYVAKGYRKASHVKNFLNLSIEILRKHGIKTFTVHISPTRGIPLRRALLNIGFKEIIRKEMSLPLKSREIPEVEFFITPFSKDYTEQLKGLMKKAFIGSVDYNIYSEFFTDSGQDKVISKIIYGSYGPFIDSCSLFIFDKRKLIGYCLVTNKGHETSFLMDFAIDPDYQGRGLGRLLLDLLTNQLHHRGFKFLNLAVTIENTRAYKLYKKAGFKTVNRFQIYILSFDS